MAATKTRIGQPCRFVSSKAILRSGRLIRFPVSLREGTGKARISFLPSDNFRTILPDRSLMPGTRSPPPFQGYSCRDSFLPLPIGFRMIRLASACYCGIPGLTSTQAINVICVLPVAAKTSEILSPPEFYLQDGFRHTPRCPKAGNSKLLDRKVPTSIFQPGDNGETLFRLVASSTQYFSPTAKGGNELTVCE